jgi:ferric-dicitrate binding protein FerR (iron transport regulator)
VSEANIDDAMAWKNGYFIFNDDNITGIMKKVCRWYNVDVEYRGNYDDQQFGGTFYRSKSITELLNHLQKIGKIHFTISGRRITVMD